MQSEIHLKKLLRIKIINECLSSFINRRVSTQTLMKKCGIGRTALMDDLQYLRDELGAPIAYDRKSKGYYYKEEYDLVIQKLALSKQDLNALKVAVKTLNQFKNLEVFRDLEGIFDKIEKAVRFKLPQEGLASNPHIQFESVPYFKGSELIEFFLEAIEHRRALRFSYRKFNNEAPKLRIIEPYLLKEHRNRWYIIGWVEQKKDYRIFGLDRIADPAYTGDHFLPRKDFDLEMMQKHSFGIFISSKEKPQSVVLSFTPERAHFFDSQPFHQYFKKIASPEKGRHYYAFYLIINEEFKLEICRMGSSVKVIEPQWLQAEIKRYLTEALNQY